jgi:hypothetical protein
LAVPKDLEFKTFYEKELEEHREKLVSIRVLEDVGRFRQSLYRVMLEFKEQATADQLFHALNGRFFSDADAGQDCEIMQTVYLSDMIMTKADLEIH